MLPLSFYFVQRLSEGGPALTAGGIGMAWAIGAAALFSGYSGRAVDQRLVQLGFRPHELFAGRVLLLEAVGLVVAFFFGTVMTVFSGPSDIGDVYVAVVFVAWI